ncbi:hypothetical protein H6F98_19650 [Microcoleus sp. FACHB-SPT15]|uniref:hypothetical protein n=1 Tax=Microcoleus sp. FACHB-SPT15 TaxID=2692830 RepID=UPI00177BFDE4|nr:hypothetical protein [Microcoleus sp. FACHB-SPT15]MBD1807642.1 hypothetical protein [Microcoleus sp. FACHB-SPT15]
MQRIESKTESRSDVSGNNRPIDQCVGQIEQGKGLQHKRIFLTLDIEKLLRIAIGFMAVLLRSHPGVLPR